MSTHNEVLSQVQSLTSDEQLRLLKELAALVRSRVTPQPQHSILELEGLGKEIWNGIDARSGTRYNHHLACKLCHSDTFRPNH